MEEGRLTVEGGKFKGKRITFHDPCYLGRGNGIYEAPRDLLRKLEVELVEMKRCKKDAMCCGAGGAQMFKEPEPGKEDVNVARTEQAIEVKPEVIAAGCPFCNTMMTDGVKAKNREDNIAVMDIAEMIANCRRPVISKHKKQEGSKMTFLSLLFFTSYFYFNLRFSSSGFLISH